MVATLLIKLKILKSILFNFVYYIVKIYQDIKVRIMWIKLKSEKSIFAQKINKIEIKENTNNFLF